MKSLSFSATIHKVDINPYISVPKEISDSFGTRGYIAVKGKLNTTPIRATLVPTGKGHYRLYINGDMRARAHVDVGDTISVALTLDRSPRKVPLPPKLVQALNRYPKARESFDALTPSRRKEILLYLNSLKTAESLERNIKKVISELAG